MWGKVGKWHQFKVQLGDNCGWDPSPSTSWQSDLSKSLRLLRLYVLLCKCSKQQNHFMMAKQHSGGCLACSRTPQTPRLITVVSSSSPTSSFSGKWSRDPEKWRMHPRHTALWRQSLARTHTSCLQARDPRCLSENPRWGENEGWSWFSELSMFSRNMWEGAWNICSALTFRHKIFWYG